MDSLSRTIQEIDSQIAAYDAEIALLETSLMSHSTPKMTGSIAARRLTNDSGFNTAMATAQNQNESGKGNVSHAPTSYSTEHQTNSVNLAQKSVTESLENEQYQFRQYNRQDLSNSQTVQTQTENEPVVTIKEYEPCITYRAQKRSNPDTSSAQSTAFKPPVTVKPATYDGSTSWLDYKSHFEACAALGTWSEQEKALYLAVSLRGQAQTVLGNLPQDVPRHYEDLVTALNERFAPPNQTELYRAQLRERRQKASESLPELGQSLKRLVNLAYPTAPGDVKEILAKENFIDALVDSDMRLRIKQARPTTLNDAVRHAIELEAFNKAEQKRKEGYLRPMNKSASPVNGKKSELECVLSRMD